MSVDLVKLAHHASALAIMAVMVLGIVAPRLKNEALRANLYPVEGMGGFGLVLFQLVSGAILAGRLNIPWNTPWIAGAVGCLLLALMVWITSLAKRSKGNTADRTASLLNIVALVAVLGSYTLMMIRPGDHG